MLTLQNIDPKLKDKRIKCTLEDNGQVKQKDKILECLVHNLNIIRTERR